MYSIKFENHLNLINWSCIYWGIKEQLIRPENAVMYANKVVEENPDIDTPEIIELLIIDEANNGNVLPLIEKMFSDKKALYDKKANSIRTLRFIFLFEIQKNITDNQELLDEIENIYADFNYPSDMESFIYYMPIQDDEYDVSEHSSQENEQHLIDKFNTFMNKEFQTLINQQSENGKNPSILTANPNKLLKEAVGKGKSYGNNKIVVDYGRKIGKFYDIRTGKYYDTTRATIHYDNKGNAHIVPARPRGFK